MADRMGLLLIVEGLGQYESAAVTVKQMNADVAQSMMGVEQASPGAQQGTAGLAMAFAKGNIAAMAITKGLSMVSGFGKKLIVDSTMLAARVDVLGTVLEGVGRNAGFSAEQIAELEEAVKSQGITTQSARQSLIMMAQANVDMAYASDLARVAQNAAVVAGTNSSEAFERLVYGLSRGNGEILNTMGLTVDFVGAEEKLAKQLGTTRKGLDNAQVMQARYAAVMESSTAIADAYTDAMGKAGKQMTSIPRYVEEIQLALGETFQPALTAIIFGVKDALAGVLEILQENKPELKEFGEALGRLVTALLEMEFPDAEDIKGFLETMTTLVRMLEVGLETWREWEEHPPREMREYEKAIRGQESAFEKLISTLGEMAGAQEVVNARWGERAYITRLMDDLNEARKEYDRLTEAEEKAAHTADVLAGRTDDLAEEMRSLKEVDREAARAERDLADAMKQTVELTEDQVKGVEALVTLRLQLQRDLADRLIAQERELLRKEISLAYEREDTARRVAKDIARAYADAEEGRVDLIEEGQEELADFQRGAAQEWADLERDAARDREDADRSYADTRVDIEIETRRRLQEIARQFEMSVQDAARTRDAFALVQAQRTAQRDREAALRGREEQLGDARTSHEREERDYSISLERQREELRQSLAEEQADIVAGLMEKQAAIEAQLQEQLLAIQVAQQQEAAEQDRQRAREQEMEAIQAAWEEEDRTRRLARQLEDMGVQYGKLYGVTAEGLLQQVGEWAETYGPEGAATTLVHSFATEVETQMLAMQQAMVDTANEFRRLVELMNQVSPVQVPLPPEFQMQSPKLGLQVGLEKLAAYMKQQPLSIMAGGRAPAVPGGGVSRQESYSRTDATQNVNLSMPPNLDLIVQRQLAGVLKQVLPQAGAR